MKTIKWIAGAVLVTVVASTLGGCIIETRHPHHYYRPVVIVR